MKQYFWWVQILSLFVSLNSHADYSLQINHINDVTHFELPEIYSANYSLVQKKDHVELTVSQLEKNSLNYIKNYSDQFIQKITVDKSSSLNKDVIKIYLTSNQVEIFDYLTDAPVALSLDFYIDDRKPSNKNSADSGPTLLAKNGGRNPSSTEFIKMDSKNQKNNQPLPSKLDYTLIKESPDVIDPKFSEISKKVTVETFDLLNFDVNKIIFSPDSIIESRGKLFLRFPILQSENKDIDQVARKKVSYEIEQSDDQETVHAIELHKLFVDGKYRPYIKGLKNFSKKYPNSKYTQMLKYMQADSVFELSKIDDSRILKKEALNIYDALVKKYPESPLAERTLLYTSIIRTQLQDHLGAVRNLKYYQSKYPKSPLHSNIDLLLAQNLLRAGEFKDAIDLYAKLINGSDSDIKIEATYNVGDAYFEHKDYKRAIALYEQAWKKFPQFKKNYPNALFNKAEAEFLEEDFKLSLESYRDFIKNFPQHDYAHYAMTRLGEIFEIIGEDPMKWRGFYNESIFRFKNTTGGAIAKIRLLWHQIATTENKRLSILVDELVNHEKLVKLPQADEFMIFQLTDAYFARGLYKKSTDELLSFYKKVEKPVYAEKFMRRIGRGIAFQIKDKIEKNELKEAFQVYENYDDLWLKKSERVDFDYYKGLAYEKAKVFPAAIQSYNEFFKKYNKLADAESVRAYEGLPSLDFMNLRLANVYLENKQQNIAFDILSKIKLETFSDLEKDEYFFISAKINTNKENWNLANSDIGKISKKTIDVVHLYVFISEKQKKYNDALAAIDNYLDNHNPKIEDKFGLLKKKIELLEYVNTKKDELAMFTQRFHEEFKDTNFNYDEIKYKLGIYFSENKKFKEAEEVWATITENTVWKNLASESIKSKKWNDQYKKYIDRIPAMADKKEGAE